MEERDTNLSFARKEKQKKKERKVSILQLKKFRMALSCHTIVTTKQKKREKKKDKYYSNGIT
jgi:hypothetical protein